ncbi:MAG: DUF1565 domain-containing protein, partial [Parabacteroides sp.]
MMKKTLLCTVVLFCTSVVCAQKTVYVSPEGNDGWNGNEQRPFKTLERALTESVHLSADTLYIQMASGDYLLNRTLNLAEYVKSPVVVCGKEEDKPRLMGGIPIKGWEKQEGNVYRAYVPEVKLYDFAF